MKPVTIGSAIAIACPLILAGIDFYQGSDEMALAWLYITGFELESVLRRMRAQRAEGGE